MTALAGMTPGIAICIPTAIPARGDTSVTTKLSTVNDPLSERSNLLALSSTAVEEPLAGCEIVRLSEVLETT